MNWLGTLIQKQISRNDTVLDLGCGIMQATTDSLTKSKRRLSFTNIPNVLECRSLLGCDVFEKYLERAKDYFPVIRFDLTDIKSFDIFMDKSFDIVMALDVIEHLEYPIALQVIGNMERISRKKIIIYTPSKYEKNEKNVENAWGMGENELQTHKCFIPPKRFEDWGYRVSFPKPDKNTLAIKVLK